MVCSMATIQTLAGVPSRPAYDAGMLSWNSDRRNGDTEPLRFEPTLHHLHGYLGVHCCVSMPSHHW